MKKLVVNCETGEQSMVDFSQEEIAQQEIDEAAIKANEAATI
jgi:hypothetical protein